MEKLRRILIVLHITLVVSLLSVLLVNAQGGGNGRNRAPRVASTPNTEAVEGNEYTYQISAQDADGDTLRYRLRMAPQGMTIDSTSGLVRWTPSTGECGSKKVVVVISDGTDETVHMFTIMVRSSHQTGSGDLALREKLNHIAVVDSLYSYQIKMRTSASGAAIKFYLGWAPDGMEIDSTTGLITWTPTSDDIGVQRVVIIITDGTNILNRNFTVVVFNEMPPLFRHGIESDTCRLEFQIANQGEAAIHFRRNARVLGDSLRFTFYDSTAPGQVARRDTLRGALSYFEFKADSADTSGEGFEAEIRVQFTEQQFQRSRLRNKLQLALAYYRESDSTWIKMPTAIDSSTNTAVCTTSHFSVWSLADEDNFDSQTQIVEKTAKNMVPTGFHLEQNYPNPFNPETRILYRIPHTVKVTIRVFNIIGQEIKTLIDTEQQAGTYAIKWNGRNNQGVQVSSGIYFYQIKTKDFVKTKKMMLIR